MRASDVGQAPSSAVMIGTEIELVVHRAAPDIAAAAAEQP
jgi:hypothetical protein